MSIEVKPLSLGAAHLPLREQVRDEIRERIVAGSLVPGARIVEREIAAELGVSRVPIREAIRMLESEGFVTVVPRRGVVVRRLSRHDVEELFDVRESLEVLAVRRATERAEDAELTSLSALVEEGSRACRRMDREGAAAHRQAFHDQIIHLAHNDLLAGLLEPLQGRLHWLFRQNDDSQALCLEHRRLAEAMASRDADRAADEALKHVRRNREISLRLLFEEPDAPQDRADAG